LITAGEVSLYCCDGCNTFVPYLAGDEPIPVPLRRVLDSGDVVQFEIYLCPTCYASAEQGKRLNPRSQKGNK